MCELVPLFDVSQPTLSHHLKELREAGIVDSERRGLWAYYYVDPRGTGGADRMAELTETREVVRERYAAARRQAASESEQGCCGTLRRRAARAACSAAVCTTTRPAPTLPTAAVEASLGCGVPTAVADLHEGETVLDLGSGAGADVLISARRVGSTGTAIGLDMTDEMLELARANAREAGVENVEFVKGYIEEIPLPDARVDVVISNCVINLSGRQAARAARGGAGAAARRALRGLAT